MKTALRQIVKRERNRHSGRPIRWVTVKGGLPEGLNVADRASMHDWLRRSRCLGEGYQAV
jgi:hypothetical protein